MFVAHQTRDSAKSYCENPQMQALLKSSAIQQALAVSLAASRAYATQRRESQVISPETAHTPIWPIWTQRLV